MDRLTGGEDARSPLQAAREVYAERNVRGRSRLELALTLERAGRRTGIKITDFR